MITSSFGIRMYDENNRHIYDIVTTGDYKEFLIDGMIKNNFFKKQKYEKKFICINTFKREVKAYNYVLTTTIYKGWSFDIFHN